MSTTAIASAHGGYPLASSLQSSSATATRLSDASKDWTVSNSFEELNGKTVNDLIMAGQVLQANTKTEDSLSDNYNSYANLGDLINKVKAAKEGKGEPVLVCVWGLANNRGNLEFGGHALWAYDVAADDSSQTVLSIYDCNHPDSSRELTLTKSGGGYAKWFYPMKQDFGYDWGTGQSNCWHWEGPEVVYGDVSAISWCLPEGDFKALMQGEYNLGGNRKLVATSSDTTLEVAGGTYQLSPFASYADSSAITPIRPLSDNLETLGAQENPDPQDVLPSAGMYWASISDNVAVPSISAGNELSIASQNSSVTVGIDSASADASLVMRVSDDDPNKVLVDFKDSSEGQFTIEYADESSSATDGVNNVVVSGTAQAGEQVTVSQSGGELKVAGASTLKVTNDEGKESDFGSLAGSASCTVYPTAGVNGKPTLATVVESGTWGTCPWEIDSLGVIAVHPGTGEEQTGLFNDEASPWKKYTSHNATPGVEPSLKATKIVFAEENGNKVIAPANCDSLLWGMRFLEEIDVSGLDTSKTTSMRAMFTDCSSATQIKGLAGFNTSKVTNMESMFNGCVNLTSIDVSSFDTRNVTDISTMFAACSSLRSVDLSSFNTAKLSNSTLDNYHLMFLSCSNLEHVTLGKGTTKLTELRTGYDSENWTSMSTGTSYSTEQIKSSRLGTADSYVKTAGLTDLAYAYIEGPTDVIYNGRAQEPAVTVKMYGQPLTRNTDYTATYSDNINVGTAKVQIIGKSPYAGAIAKTFLVKSKPATPTPSTPAYQTMHRLYNPNSGEHFYTASAAERDMLRGVGWAYEGEGWKAPKTGANVYRLYNANAGDHHYTTSAAERDYLVGVGWSYEGVGWKSGGSRPLYRQYNPNAVAGSHNYTTSKAENDWLASLGWRPEGVGWYGV